MAAARRLRGALRHLQGGPATIPRTHLAAATPMASQQTAHLQAHLAELQRDGVTVVKNVYSAVTLTSGGTAILPRRLLRFLC